MAVISGKDGTLTVGGSPQSHVLNWVLNVISENHAYHSNASAGSRQRTAGVKDSNGTFDMIDTPSFEAGDEVELVLYTNQDIWTLTALIDQVTVTAPIDAGSNVTFAVTFSGHGAAVQTTGSAP